MRVTVLQMNPTQDKVQNIAQARSLIEAAVLSDRPDLIGLPEVWSCLGGTNSEKFAAAETLPESDNEGIGGPAYEFLRESARSHHLYIHGGSIIEKSEGRLFNTTIVFDPEGRESARYRKIHLFDVHAPDDQNFEESATFGAGNQIVNYCAAGVNVGCAICYDLRFPELFLALRRAGADLIFLPSAFTMQTGRDHWETLIRARAIDNQCWLAAPAAWGKYLDGNRNARFTYGRSLVCDPWGVIAARASDGIGWVTARIDLELTRKIRRDMPVLDHRRLA